MGIRTSCADEDGLNLGMVLEVRCKGFSHGLVVLLEREVVFLGRVMDKGRYCREGVGCDDVNSLKSRGEAVGGGGLGGVGVEGCEVEDEQDETVFAAVVAEGKVVEATMIINQSVHTHTLSLSHTHALLLPLPHICSARSELLSSGRTHLYLSNASSITPKDSLVVRCTCLKRELLFASWRRKASTRAWTFLHASPRS